MTHAQVKRSLTFPEWAIDYSGMVGGNLKGKLWLCGLEYGGSEDLENLVFELPEPQQPYHNGVPCLDDKSELLSWKPQRRYFDYRVAKVACAYFNLPMTGYQDYFLNRLYHHNGDTFRMNLYPLAFPSTDQGHWQNVFTEKTGFQNKEDYKAWCREHRFPFLKNLLKTHEPEVLICTGLECFEDFKLAFLDDPIAATALEIQWLDSKGQKKTFYFYRAGKTKLIIVPFLGNRHGLVSNEHLLKLGEFAREEKLDPVPVDPNEAEEGEDIAANDTFQSLGQAVSAHINKLDKGQTHGN